MDESSSESNDSYRKYKPYYEKKFKYNMKTEVNELQNLMQKMKKEKTMK